MSPLRGTTERFSEEILFKYFYGFGNKIGVRFQYFLRSIEISNNRINSEMKYIC